MGRTSIQLWTSHSGQGDKVVRSASDRRGRDGAERGLVGEQRDKRGAGIMVCIEQNEVNLRQIQTCVLCMS